METASPYLPISYRVHGVEVLVVGAGPVAARRIALLLRRGADVTVVAPEISPAVRRFAKHGNIRLIEAPFRKSHLDGRAIVFCATDDPRVHRAVSQEAARRRIPVNVADSPEECSFILPATVEKEEFTLAVSTGGRNPGAARAIREFLDDHRSEISVRMERGRRRKHLRACPGTVYIVGAGPGDPDLLTVRALGLLRSADAVIHDYLVPEEILSLAPAKARRICYARKGRTAGHGSALKQAAIHQTMARLAREGRRVVRLKSGDPLVFGRGGEEAEFLASEGIRFEIVPGITAAVACAASAMLPLTRRGVASSVTFVSAREAGERQGGNVAWKRIPRDGTIAIYMGAGRTGEILEGLTGAGFPPDLPFAVVENGTRRTERVLCGKLRELPRIADREGLRSPAILFVGKTAGFAIERNMTKTAVPRAEGEGA